VGVIYFGSLPNAWYGQNFGFDFSPIPDWAVGSYKGECGSAQAVSGVSIYTPGNFSDALVCGDTRLATGYSGCYARSITSGHDNRGDTDAGWDWDSGHVKAECSVREYVAGVAQDTSGHFNTVLCCAGSVNHRSCYTQAPASFATVSGAGPDFDPNTAGYNDIARCFNDGSYLAGASSGPGAIHKLLCCHP